MKSFNSAVLAAALTAVFYNPPALADEDLKVGKAREPNQKPGFLGIVKSTCYTAKGSETGDDLLTGGLGKTGLAAAAPAFANPAAPTAAELRRNAIHTNYRAVLDITAGGGYGTLYGPNLDKDGKDTGTEGKIPGCEHLAFADDGSGRKNVTLMVQVPDSFDVKNPCIVTATSSGSRGVYGAIGASGEWGLKKDCAVAYTDKGTGNGLHDLVTDSVGLIDGQRTAADTAGKASHFTAPLNDAERAAFNAAFPNRVAYKHAHSEQNPEKDWGKNTLQSIVFAFFVLNEKFGTPGRKGEKQIVLDRRNTLVIASGISNGAGGALAAAEQDRDHLIDGVAVTEPQVQVEDAERISIQQGAIQIETIGKPLFDYFTVANLYQPCAALSSAAAGSPALLFLSIPVIGGPLVPGLAPARCAGLKAKGLLSGTTLAAQADEALAKLRGYGWLADSNLLHASHYRFATNAIAVTYANAYGRFSVADNVCGFSFANTNLAGDVVPQSAVAQASIFSTGNGVPPTTGVNIVYNLSQGGAKLDLLAVSPSTGAADFALDGAICHRNLLEGRDIVTGAPLMGEAQEISERVRRGIRRVLLEGELRGTPAIIVHGRSDALVPVNHSSRPYYAKTQLEGDGKKNVRYIEVTNAQHFDAFLPGGLVFGGYENLFVPLHVYLIRALDRMYDHLKQGKALPPSQVVRTIPRGGTPGTAPAITLTNVPPIQDAPPAGDRITFRRSTLHVPD